MGIVTSRPLFSACKTGNLDAVQAILENLPSDEICLLEANSTTVLHEAVARENPEIVKALISRCCARTLKNKESLTAYEIARNPSIRQLLLRSSKTSRFEQKPCYFVENAFGIWRSIVNTNRLVECGYNEKVGIEDRRICALYWIQTALNNADERYLIRKYFNLAFQMNSAKPIFEAFTEETYFYTAINQALVNEPDSRTFNKEESNGALLIARNLFKGIYDGKHGENYNQKPLYSRSTLDSTEIEWYKSKIGKPPLSLKLFWSLTKCKKFAESMVGNVIFILKCTELTTKRTMSLENLSGYPYEREVLLAPMTKIKIHSVVQIDDERYTIEMHFWDW